MQVQSVDAVIGLQYGDEGKGKIAAAISQQIDYDLIARYNGGSNAGHTISFEYGPALKLHQIPSGAVFKKASYIGPGALINFSKLEDEAKHFQEVMGFNPYEYLTISPKAIVVTAKNLQQDVENQAKTQGSTSSGVAPAYANFYARNASLAKDFTFPYQKKELIQECLGVPRLLLEGAQGWYLNPYQGNYPFTTSSSSHPASAAVTFGFPASKLNNIIGVAKCYETRSGIDPTFNKLLTQDNQYTEVLPDLKAYDIITDLGNEYGVTTGRRRAVRFLDLTRLVKAINQSGTTILVLQKWDILQEANFYYDNIFCYYFNGKKISAPSLEQMIRLICSTLNTECSQLKDIILEASPICTTDWKKYL
jgi:adenylosuccinate synthase